MSEVYLQHYGVKGMRWGVRRYQNPDGSLTPKGKKRYDAMSDDKLQKTLSKQVSKARAKQSNPSTPWLNTHTIGKNSKAATDKYYKDLNAHQDSKKYIEAKKKYDALHDLFDDDAIAVDKYITEIRKLDPIVNKREFDSTVRITSKGREYSESYMNKYGKKLNIAYLKDLGYDEETSKYLAERIDKADKRMIDGGQYEYHSN